MLTNDILRRLRFALRMDDPTMLKMLRLGGSSLDAESLAAYFKRDDESGYLECPKPELSALLDGMILKFRGPRPEGSRAPELALLDNNMVLKKLRIAFGFKEEDMIAIMKRSGVEISKNELSALFRSKTQKNYMECMDQFLRHFLAGMDGYKDYRV